MGASDQDGFKVQVLSFNVFNEAFSSVHEGDVQLAA